MLTWGIKATWKQIQNVFNHPKSDDVGIIFWSGYTFRFDLSITLQNKTKDNNWLASFLPHSWSRPNRLPKMITLSTETSEWLATWPVFCIKRYLSTCLNVQVMSPKFCSFSSLCTWKINFWAIWYKLIKFDCLAVTENELTLSSNFLVHNTANFNVLLVDFTFTMFTNWK